MNRSVYLIAISGLFCVALLQSAGCGAANPAKNAPPPVHHASVNGIRFEIHGAVGANIEIVNNEVKVTNGPNAFSIKDGRLSLNGAERGPIKSGDTVVLDSGGQLFVNGEMR